MLRATNIYVLTSRGSLSSCRHLMLPGSACHGSPTYITRYHDGVYHRARAFYLGKGGFDIRIAQHYRETGNKQESG